jgi:predicted enzyme related to lactoylglutathione lyase
LLSGKPVHVPEGHIAPVVDTAQVGGNTACPDHSDGHTRIMLKEDVMAKAPLFDNIGMLTLHVNDFDRAVKFYRDTLGLTPEGVYDEAGFAEFTLKDGVKLGIHRDDCAQIPDGRRPGGATGFYIETDDVDAKAAELKARGVTITEDVKQQSFGTTVAFADPDGNEFCFIKPAQ